MPAPVSTLSFKCALITGGVGGLGHAMANPHINGQIGYHSWPHRIKANPPHPKLAQLHIIPYIPAMSDSYPLLFLRLRKNTLSSTCLINNAGIQRPFQALGPDYDFDLAKADQEIDINIRGPLHLSLGLLPHFDPQPNGGVIMNISSVLGYLPYSVINPVYNGTKSGVHMFSMDLRTQLAQAGSKVRVVEIVPSSVETNLHREMKNPDDNKQAKGATSSMTINEFMDDVITGWKADDDTVAAGSGKALVKKWYDAYGEEYLNGHGEQVDNS